MLVVHTILVKYHTILCKCIYCSIITPSGSLLSNLYLRNRHLPTWTDGLVCDEPFCEVICVSLHMSVITQDGDSALMMAVREGMTEVFSLLLKAGANTDLQNKV